MPIDTMLSIAQGVSKGSIGHDFIYCLEEERFYIYESGYWKVISEIELMSLVMQYYTGENNTTFLGQFSVSRRSQVLDNLRYLIFKKLEVFNKNGYLNFPEGEMDMETGYIHPHSKENCSTLRMPYHFRFGAKCPLWLKTLDEVFEGNQDKIHILQEFFGYCLTRDTKQRKALLLIGECLGGETLIFDPVKKKSIPISEITEDFHVESWDGEKIVVARALKPFQKEIDDLYTVTLNNGQSFVCSMSHKILTSSGYRPLSELHEGCEIFLPETILDNGQLTHVSNVQNFLRKVEDSQSYYPACSCLYDGQPQKVLNIFPNASPLQVDVQGYDLENISLRKGETGYKQKHSHLYQLSCHLSTLDACYLLHPVFYKLYYISCIAYKLIVRHTQVFLQSMLKIFHSQPIYKSSPSDNYSYSRRPYSPLSLVITSIVYKRRDVKWDFTVPKYHNYICGGAVHHNSNCGKSTILWTLRNMLGDENCASVSINNIMNPQHTANMMNKLVNIDTDVSQDARSYEEQFKKVAGGEPVECNPKYVAPFSVKLYARIVMGSNGFPRVTDHSDAFFNRLIMIPCDRIFHEEEQNKDLPEELKQELSGIFNWAWEGLQRLNERGRFEIKDFMKQARQDLRDESNPIDVFFRDRVEVKEHAYVEKQDLYRTYCEWCKSNGNLPMSTIKFNKTVWQKYSKKTEKNSQLNTGERVWRNLRYKDSVVNAPQTEMGWSE